MAGKPIPEEVVAQLCDRMLTAAIGKDWRKRAPEAVTAFWMGEVREALQEVAPALTAAQQQAVATPLPGDKGSVQALFNPTLQPMQQGGGEINMDVTVRDGAWVGTYAEWCRRKQDTPPSAPVGVEDVVMAARNAENAIRNCAAAGQIGEGYVQYADDLRDAVQRLAQQPAAVDEAIAQRAAKALLDCRSYIGSERPDDPDDEDSAQWWDELTELAAALATQHREPTDDR